MPPSGRFVVGEVSQRFPGPRQVAFAFVQVKGLGGCGMRVAGPAGRGEDVREIKQGVGVLAEQVGLPASPPPSAQVILPRDSGRGRRGSWPTSLTDGLGGQILTRGFLAYRDQADGFVVPAWTLRPRRLGQLRRGGGEVAPLAHIVEGVVFDAKVPLGGGWIAGQHRNEGGRMVIAPVIVGPRVSRRYFALLSEAYAASNIVLHRLQAARFCRISALPKGWLPISARYSSHRRIPSEAGVGPRCSCGEPAEISDSSLRSFTLRA